MRTIPVLVALLVGIAGLSVGTVVASPSAGDATSADRASQHLIPDEPENASADRMVLEVSVASVTVDEMNVDRVETDRGTVENATLEEAEVTVDNATIIVENVSSEDRSVEHAFVTIVDGSVTVEEATATANGVEYSVNDVSAEVENESATGDELEFDGAQEMQIDRGELQQLLEGSSVEEFSIEGVSADAHLELADFHNVQVDGNTGHAIFGDLALESFEDASVSAESARIEDGTLILEDAEVTVQSAEVNVDIGVVSMDDEHHIMDNEDVEIDGPVTITRDELRIQLW